MALYLSALDFLSYEFCDNIFNIFPSFSEFTSSVAVLWYTGVPHVDTIRRYSYRTLIINDENEDGVLTHEIFLFTRNLLFSIS